MEIVIDAKPIQKALTKFDAELRATRPLMEQIGRAVRDYTKETIYMGGRTSWPPLSVWTIERTGRYNPLQPLAARIRYTANKDIADVWFDAPSEEWSLEQHEKGYYIPARVGRPVMVIPLLSGPFYTRSVKRTYVPPRRVWPTPAEINPIIMAVTEQWLEETEGRAWQ